MRVKDALGRFGEDVAARHLGESGLEILERNWRCRRGEIDIVARDGDVLVFCEVKTRSGRAFGSPAEAVAGAKARRVRALASCWLAEHAHPYAELRFDVVGVVRDRDGLCVEHLRGVF